VTVDSTVIAVLAPKNRWFPDIAPRRTRIRVVRGDNERVITTIQPAPLLEFTPDVSVGANFGLGSVRPSIGIEVVRISILRMGFNAAYDTRTKKMDLGPEIATQLRTNLMLGAGVTLNGQNLFLSLKYKF
jgi:hypothetical protein